jgi:hypothetical protein
MNTVKIAYNWRVKEYRVRLYIDGVLQNGADYFTSDRECARYAAEYMRKHGRISSKRRGFST